MTGQQITAVNLNAHVEDAVIVADAVTTAKILDGAVATAKLAADAVDGTKVADDAIDSEHIAAGAIDLEHFSPEARPVSYDFSDASNFIPGFHGLVPGPKIGQNGYFLRTDGWIDPDAFVTPTVDAAMLASASIAHYNHANFG